jgi:hypothetical protein
MSSGTPVIGIQVTRRWPTEHAMSKGRPIGDPRRSTFVVRIDRDDRGDVRGVIEHVRTGETEPFRGLEAIGCVIAGMMKGERRDSPALPGDAVRGPPGSHPSADREADA